MRDVPEGQDEDFSMIEAVVFDVGGVITAESKEGLNARAARILKVPLEDYLNIAGKVEEKWASGKLSDVQAYQLMGKQLGVDQSEVAKAEEKAYKEIMQINKPVVRLADRIRKAGYITPILTNTIDLHKVINTKWGIYAKFNPVICSCDVGCIKPAKKIYDIMISKVGVPADQTIFIDDHAENIVAANKTGIHGIVFRNITQLKKDLAKLGVKVK